MEHLTDYIQLMQRNHSIEMNQFIPKHTIDDKNNSNIVPESYITEQIDREIDVSLREFIITLWVVLLVWFISYTIVLRYRSRSLNRFQRSTEPLSVHLVALAGAVALLNLVLVPFTSVVVSQLSLNKAWLNGSRMLWYIWKAAVAGSEIALFVFLPIAFLDVKVKQLFQLHKPKWYRHIQRIIVSIILMATILLSITGIGAAIQFAFFSQVSLKQLVQPSASYSLLLPGMLVSLLVAPAGNVELLLQFIRSFVPVTHTQRCNAKQELLERRQFLIELGSMLEKLLSDVRKRHKSEKIVAAPSPPVERVSNAITTPDTTQWTPFSASTPHKSNSPGDFTSSTFIEPRLRSLSYSDSAYHYKTMPSSDSPVRKFWTLQELAEHVADETNSTPAQPCCSPSSQTVLSFVTTNQSSEKRSRSQSDFAFQHSSRSNGSDTMSAFLKGFDTVIKDRKSDFWKWLRPRSASVTTSDQSTHPSPAPTPPASTQIKADHGLRLCNTDQTKGHSSQLLTPASTRLRRYSLPAVSPHTFGPDSDSSGYYSRRLISPLQPQTDTWQLFRQKPNHSLSSRKVRKPTMVSETERYDLIRSHEGLRAMYQICLYEEAAVSALERSLQRPVILWNTLMLILFLSSGLLGLLLLVRAGLMPFVRLFHAFSGHELNWLRYYYTHILQIGGTEAALWLCITDVTCVVWFTACCFAGFYPDELSSTSRLRYMVLSVFQLIQTVASETTVNITYTESRTSTPLPPKAISALDRSKLEFYHNTLQQLKARIDSPSSCIDLVMARYTAFTSLAWQKLRPIRSATSLKALLFHAGLLVVLSFAMPVAVCWLGLSTTEVMHVADFHYGNVSIDHSGLAAFAYSAVFSSAGVYFLFRIPTAVIHQACKYNRPRRQNHIKSD